MTLTTRKPDISEPVPTAPDGALRLALDEAALAANWRALDGLSGKASAGAAIKADAYGVGARRVVPVLAKAGARDFFVAHWREAADVIDLVEPGRIAVLHGPVTQGDVHYARTTGLRPVINSMQQARLWRDGGGGPCDLMVDTGMNRLGVSLADLSEPTIAALDIDVLHSHLASADEDSALNAVQCARWNAAREQMPHRRAALANSAGIVLGAAYHGHLTRPGLSLYGGIARGELADVIRPVATPQAMILQVRDVRGGETVGYNATFTAPHSMRLATLSIGYADGYMRCWSDIGSFTREGISLPVVGRVSMDLVCMDISQVPHLVAGDWVDAVYHLPTAANRTGLSQYELLTLMGRRFTR